MNREQAEQFLEKFKPILQGEREATVEFNKGFMEIIKGDDGGMLDDAMKAKIEGEKNIARVIKEKIGGAEISLPNIGRAVVDCHEEAIDNGDFITAKALTELAEKLQRSDDEFDVFRLMLKAEEN